MTRKTEGRVAGKIALVTGAGSGIGAAIAENLAAHGATVIVTDRSQEAAEAVAQRIGEGASARQLDVADEAQWQAMSALIERCEARLDILVNNAGILILGDVEDTSLADFRKLQAVMSEGVFLGCKHMMPWLRASGAGSIINISSTAALRGYRGFVGYSAAKGAVRAMTMAMAITAQDRGDPVRVNAIMPGDIETPMQQAYDGRSASRDIPRGILPKCSVGAPEDIAAMALFLASDEARFITAAEFVVDNGEIMRPAFPQ